MTLDERKIGKGVNLDTHIINEFNNVWENGRYSYKSQLGSLVGDISQYELSYKFLHRGSLKYLENLSGANIERLRLEIINYFSPMVWLLCKPTILIYYYILPLQAAPYFLFEIASSSQHLDYKPPFHLRIEWLVREFFCYRIFIPEICF